MSPCGSDHIFTSLLRGWRVVSEDSWVRLLRIQAFPADCPHRTLFHRATTLRGSAGYSGFPAYSQLRSAGSLLRWAVPGLRPGVTLGPFVTVTPDVAVGGAVISAALFASPRRPDYIIAILADRVWRVVSEDSRTPPESTRPNSGDFRRHSCPIESEGSPRSQFDLSDDPPQGFARAA